MAKFIIGQKDGWARNRCTFCFLHSTCNASLPESKQDCPLSGAKLAVAVDVPEGRQFKAVFERGGVKGEDWEPVKVYAVLEGIYGAGTIEDVEEE